jgi:hypothetical protein
MIAAQLKPSPDTITSLAQAHGGGFVATLFMVNQTPAFGPNWPPNTKIVNKGQVNSTSQIPGFQTGPYDGNIGDAYTVLGDPLLLTNDTDWGWTGSEWDFDWGFKTDLIRVAVIKNGSILGPESYLMYDTILPWGHTTIIQEISITAGDSIAVYSLNGTTSFTLSGTQY